MWLLCFLLVINICRANEEQCNCDALVNKVINFQTNQLSELEIYKQKTNLLWERQENFIATLKDQNTGKNLMLDNKSVLDIMLRIATNKD